MLETFNFIVRPCSNWGGHRGQSGTLKFYRTIYACQFTILNKLQPVGCELFVTQLFQMYQQKIKTKSMTDSVNIFYLPFASKLFVNFIYISLVLLINTLLRTVFAHNSIYGSAPHHTNSRMTYNFILFSFFRSAQRAVTLNQFAL